MRSPVFITIWLLIFLAWLWIMNRVNRAFWYTGRADMLLSLTFYTGGVLGILLLLGRKKRSPLLAQWVEEILESKPAESISTMISGREKAASLKQNLLSFWTKLQKNSDDGYTMVTELEDIDDGDELEAYEQPDAFPEKEDH